VNGSPFIAAEYQGATYYFATEEHKALFAANPDKYAPQCGGFCAYGVGLGKLFPWTSNTWQVRTGKLYLNLKSHILKKFMLTLKATWPRRKRIGPVWLKKNGK